MSKYTGNIKCKIDWDMFNPRTSTDNLVQNISLKKDEKLW